MGTKELLRKTIDAEQFAAANRDSVPYLIVVNRADGTRAVIDSDAGEGLKATVSMKNDIEELTGENTVEIMF